MPSTHYLSIIALQAPFSIGVDEIRRAQISCNYLCQIDSSFATFEESIIKLISDASLGTSGTNLWASTQVEIPPGDGPYIVLITTGGLSSELSHNGDKLPRPSIQVIVTALDYVVARDRAYAIWGVLDGLHNVTVSA